MEVRLTTTFPTLNTVLSLKNATTSTWPPTVPYMNGSDVNRWKTGEVSVAVLSSLTLCVIMVLAFCGNILVLFIIIKHSQLRTVVNAFIASLSISDLLTMLTCMPEALVTIFSRDWILGRVLCVLNGTMNSAFSIASTLTLTLIAIDRYHAFVRRPNGRISARMATVMLASVWTGAFFFAFPWYVFMPHVKASATYHKSGFYHCMYIFHTNASYTGTAYSILVVIICYLAPLAVMIFCSVNIWRTVRASDSKVRPASAQPSQLFFVAEMRTANTVVIMVIVFVICRCCYCIMALVSLGMKTDATVAMDTVAMWLSWSNCAINPIIYSCRNPNVANYLQCWRRRFDQNSRSFSNIQVSASPEKFPRSRKSKYEVTGNKEEAERQSSIVSEIFMAKYKRRVSSLLSDSLSARTDITSLRSNSFSSDRTGDGRSSRRMRRGSHLPTEGAATHSRRSSSVVSDSAMTEWARTVPYLMFQSLRKPEDVPPSPTSILPPAKQTTV